MILNKPRIQKLVKESDQLKRFVSEIFKKLDKDKSGFIDKHEIEEVMHTIANELGFAHPMREDTSDIVRMIDQNGDEMVSKLEFQITIQSVIKILGEEALSGKYD